MPLKQVAEKKNKKILVLCVDRDGDLGVKTGIKTPLIGKKLNLEAAVQLALCDPEEADANAMFEAVRIYDMLKKEEIEEIEVATISGSQLGGVGSDRKIVEEINELLKLFSTDEVILVTDGYSDEAVIPLIESRVPVSSVRRIVVKHSETIEETAALINRYFKAILETPRYSRVILGLPGILLLILVTFTIFDLLYYYWIAFVLVLSIFMLIKGFGIDDSVKHFFSGIKTYFGSPPPLRVQISYYSTVIGALCIVIGCYLGFTNVATFFMSTSIPLNLSDWLTIFPKIAGLFIKEAVTLIIIGTCTSILGRAIHYYIERNIKLLRNVALIVSVAWSRQIFVGTSNLLIDPTIDAGILIFPIVIGVMIAVASIMVIFLIHKVKGEFFEESEEKVEEFGDNQK